MNIIQEQIENKGLKKKWIAEQLDISTRTLNDWVNYRKIDQVYRFLKLCELLNINVAEVAEEIEKTQK